MTQKRALWKLQDNQFFLTSKRACNEFLSAPVHLTGWTRNHQVSSPDKKYVVTFYSLAGQIQFPTTVSNLLQNFSLILKKGLPFLIKAKLLGVIHS